MNATIKIMITFLLLISIGFSSWTYSSNLIQNGNFSEIRWSYGDNLLPNPNFTDNITGWSEEGATWVNDSGNGIANLTGDAYLVAWNGTDYYYLGQINTGEYYYWSFLFKTDNASALLQSNIDGGSDTYINTTTVCYHNPEAYPEEGCLFPIFLLEPYTSITSQGGGWYKFETIFNTSISNGGELDCYIQANHGESVQIDNVIVMNATSLPADWYQQDYSNCSANDTAQWDFNQMSYVIGEYVNWTTNPDDGIDLFSSPYLLQKDKIYYVSVDFIPYNPIAEQVIYLYQNDSICSESIASNALRWNSTDAFNEVGQTYYSDFNIVSIGSGWYRLTARLSTNALSDALVYTRIDFSSYTWTGNYSIDNVVLKEATYTSESATPIYISRYSPEDIPKQIIDFIGGIMSSLSAATTAIIWMVVAGILIGIAIELIHKVKEMKK